MIILRFGTYRDGGTVEIVTSVGVFCFDRRIGTNTEGKLYLSYPKTDNSNIVKDSSIEEKLIKELYNYKNSIEGFLKSREGK